MRCDEGRKRERVIQNMNPVTVEKSSQDHTHVSVDVLEWVNQHYSAHSRPEVAARVYCSNLVFFFNTYQNVSVEHQQTLVMNTFIQMQIVLHVYRFVDQIFPQ